MDIGYVTYKKQQFPVRLSYRVFKGMKTDLKGLATSKLESLDPEVLETMLWYGLVSGHKYVDQELKFKKEDMEDVLDSCFDEFIKLIPQFFPNAKLGKAFPDLEENEESQPQQPEESQPAKEETTT